MKFEEEADLIVDREKEEKFVYFLLKDNDVVYVGQTTKGMSRPMSHKDKDFDKVAIIYTDKLDYLESYFIAKYAPKYNVMLSSDVLFVSFKKAKEIIKENLSISSYSVVNLRKDMQKINAITTTLQSGISYISKKSLYDILTNIYGLQEVLL